MPNEPQNLLAAKEYARLGWRVFPLVPKSKAPLTPQGFHEATLDQRQIEEWWLMTPSAGIGIATGSVSKLVVVDIDPRNGGHEALAYLEAKYGALPDTVESQTGGGGRHLFYKLPGTTVFPGAKGLWNGIDIKADGGYVCRITGSRILTRDLRWVPIERLELGQGLWGFDDVPPGRGVNGRGWLPTVVTGLFPMRSTVLRVVLKSGRELLCTPEHRFLGIRRGGNQRDPRRVVWLRADALAGRGTSLARYMEPWEEDTTKEAGWFAGLLDGEGSVEGPSPRLSFCQKRGAVLARAISFLKSRNLHFSISTDSATGVETVRLRGSTQDLARILGTIRPSRLVQSWHPTASLYVRSQYAQAEYDDVVSVEVAGKRTVWVLTTSTGTFFDEGFGSHNCAPFTVHPSGLKYHWREDHDPNAELAELPAWVLEALKARKASLVKEVSQAVGDPAERIIPEGQRDNALTSLAGTMQRRGMSFEAILRAILAENTARCRPPLPETDVLRIVRSVGRYAADPDADVSVPRGTLERSLAFLDVASVVKPEPISWLLHERVAFGDVSLIVGPPASGKSWMTYEIAVAGAMGLPILGEYDPGKRLKVLLIDEENPPEEVMRRLWLLTSAWGIQPRELSGTLLVSRPCQGWSFRDRANVYALQTQVEQFQPDVVIFDSFVAVSTVKDEADAPAVRQFFHDLAYPIRAVCNSTLLFVHHTNKGVYQFERQSSSAGLVRGSIDFVAAVDSLLMVETHKVNPGNRRYHTIESVKVRRGEAPDAMSFELRSGADGQGLRPVLTEVTVQRERGGRPIDPDSTSNRVRAMVLDLLQKQDGEPCPIAKLRRWIEAAAPEISEHNRRKVLQRMVAERLISFRYEDPTNNRSAVYYLGPLAGGESETEN